MLAGLRDDKGRTSRSTGDATTGDATTGDATTGDATTGDATTGDATTGDATTGDHWPLRESRHEQTISSMVRAYMDEGFDAIIFDLDGVLTDTAALHEQAWSAAFAALGGRPGPVGEALSRRPFGHDDYVRLVDGEDRQDGVRHVLADRGVTVEQGSPDDGPEAGTVWGIASDKDRRYRALLTSEGPRPYPSAPGMLAELRGAGFELAVVSASRHAAEVLDLAGLSSAIDVRVDGLSVAAMDLPGKPDPAMYLEAAFRLGVEPGRAVVVEDALAGVEAGRLGGFGMVVGVDHQGTRREALLAHGANVVVADVGALPPAARNRRTVTKLRFDDLPTAGEGAVETLTTVGNGYVATRGARPWAGDDGTSYPGTYAAGVFNRLRARADEKTEEFEGLAKLPNWTVASVRAADGGWLGEDPAVEVSDHRVWVDLEAGLFVRRCVVHHADGHRTALVERRLASMVNPHLLAQELSVVPLDWSGVIEVRMGIDTGVRDDETMEERLAANHQLEWIDQGADDEKCSRWIRTRTVQSGVMLAMAARSRVTVHPSPVEGDGADPSRPGRVEEVVALQVTAGGRATVEKVVALYTSRDRAISEPGSAARQAVGEAQGFAGLAAGQRRAWSRLWHRSSVVVAGRSAADAGAATATHGIVALHLFHLLQVASPHLPELDAGIGARGLHGEGYRGHVFWDSMFLFQVLNMRLPPVARSLLAYRYRRLPAARRAARSEGVPGALFPWQSGSDGREETPREFLNPLSGRWMPDNTRLERHVGLAIAYEAWQHWQVTGDLAFLAREGAELIIEVARAFAGLARLDPVTRRHRIGGVMGPDEFHDGYPWKESPGLDDNAYTNVMTSWLLWRARELVELLTAEGMTEGLERIGADPAEAARWEQISRTLYVPFHGGVISQFEGFERLAELDLQSYRERYGDIGRMDLILESEGDLVDRYQVIKQPDALMLFYLLSAEELRAVFERMGYRLTPELIRRTVHYYDQRVTHGSSLSRVVHAWVMARSDRRASWRYFREALEVDVAAVGNRNLRSSRDGIHLGAMGGTVDLLQRCYTGLEVRGEALWLHPQLPEPLGHLRMELMFRGHLLELELDRARLRVQATGRRPTPVTLMLRGEPLVVRAGETVEASLD